MALPLMPGNSPNAQLGKERFHKSQHFMVYSGRMTVDLEKPGIGGEPLIGQKNPPKYSVYPKGEGSDLPSWVAFDKQTLCFEAYFKETEFDAKVETHRIRKCKIFFYLEDDTIQVIELRFKNSGLPQGTLIHRHRIPLPPPNDDQFYNVFHFNINKDIVFYSRTFTVTNCDLFTKNFLSKLGLWLNEPATVPEDPYTNLRQQHEASMNPLRPYERLHPLKQFLENDGKTLRFYCLWDDTDNLFGDQRELVLHYYLADDTVEIIEVIPPNSGRVHVSKFLRRCKLPKNAPVQMKPPGAVTTRTVLNVFGSMNEGKHIVLDSCDIRAATDEFYKDSDLAIGKEINVWGRRVLLTDCDEFTKAYYRFKYGREDFTPVQHKAPPAPKPPKPVPPYNGFGSEEDSLGNCQGLLPKPVHKDFKKFMEKDSSGLNSNVLSFKARMITTDPVHRERVFLIRYYLSDDSISVFEQEQQNSGIIGGKFLERQRVKKPGQELFKSEPSEYFMAQDLYVGGTICMNGVRFRLVDADDYTLGYMELHSDEFPITNIGTIFSKLRSISEDKQNEVRTFLSNNTPINSGFVHFESFRDLVMGLNCGLTEHEALALARRYSDHPVPKEDVAVMLSVAQHYLRRKQFEDYNLLSARFVHSDRQKSGRLPAEEVRNICKAFMLPIPESLQDALLTEYTDGGGIDYHAFVAGLNWLEHPAPAVMADDILKYEVNARFDVGRSALKNINCSKLVKEIFSFSPNRGEAEAAAST
ncbi:EF-hand domain-containing family member C2 isoform X1 [Xiphophorus hellerii]|uniref:EF-hand domain-containing family member C2 isoform X1 n=2 Tax=Xiphophorus hellerii TaxID=8084 RepID=UPI0013B41035|nr:EF-hand domain-containing family member C2 isoform X1 [Xiphophorus hellerii]